MEKFKARYIIISGATATGKSKIGMQLCEIFKGQIISADSAKVYRFMDIGTAKPSIEDRKRTVHHIIDVVKPDEHFDAAIFRKMALTKIKQLTSSSIVPFVVGGTGFYIRALRRGLVKTPSKNESLRKQLYRLAETKGSKFLYEKLISLDPEAEGKIHPSDLVRIIRAMEIYHHTGIPATRLRKKHGFKSETGRALQIVISIDRNNLKRRIKQRAKQMVEAGLIEEVLKLKEMGYGPELKSMKMLNYRHAWSYIKGEFDRESLIDKMTTDTYHFAKRQINWFKSEKDVIYMEPDMKKLETLIEKFLNEK